MAGRKQTATMELAIGATIIAAVIMLIVMLMAWGNSTSILGRHYRVVVNMVNVGGLKEGAPVKMGGFQIGRVASIQFQQGSTNMEIILDIDNERRIPKGSTAKVSTAGLVGDSFMEIIPSKSQDSVFKAASVAEAEHLDSAPLPDIQELFVKVNDFGDQLTILTTNLNDIVGDPEFSKSVKSLVVNIDAVSYQANLILQRGQNVVDNIEQASQNIAVLSTTLKDSVEKVTDNIEDISDRAREIAAKADKVIDNVDGGVTDARRAINSTLGDPDFAADLSASIANLKVITQNFADRREAIDNFLANLDTISGDLKGTAGKVRDIFERVNPEAVGGAVNSMTGAIASLTDIAEKIKAEPVLALSINKAADRIVKMKFDEMSRQPQFRSSDAVLDEINRWIRETLRRGYHIDPAYQHNQRPYVMNP